MFEYAKVCPIYGPPGTGKTTKCIQLVANLLEEGVDAKQIAYIAFTNKAANEARERVANKLQIQKTGMNYFSTIHAMANRAFKAEYPDSLGIMKAGDFEEVGNRTSLPVRAHWRITEDADFIGGGGVQYGPGDQAMSQINLARARAITVQEQLEKYADPLDLVRFGCDMHDVYRFEKMLESYKQVEGKYDFNDMLSRAEQCEPLPIRYAIVDEAQDLSAAQWRVCHYLLRNCEMIWIAGDDDQAIYRFSGADADKFVDMGSMDRAEVLHQTYRLPQAIYEYTQRIIANVTNRVTKEFTTKKPGGKVDPTAEMDGLNLDEGEWMFLVRNRGFMNGFEERMRSMGYAYKLDGRSSVNKKYLDAIRGWEKVRKGEMISSAAAAAVYDRMESKTGIQFGFKTKIRTLLNETGRDQFGFADLVVNGLLMPASVPWYAALAGLPGQQVAYLRRVAKKQELFDPPRISINTIHGVKGGEADNVVVLPAMGRLTWDGFLAKNEDDEHRCAYVAASRAKENLYILAPDGRGTGQDYPYPALLDL